MKKSKIFFSALLSVPILIIATAHTTVLANSIDGVWHDIDPTTVPTRGTIHTRPSRFAMVALNKNQLVAILSTATLETQDGKGVVLDLPMPDGSYQAFNFFESPVMHETLAKDFPEIRTYAGQGVDDPAAWARIDTTPLGFHAMMRVSVGTVFVDPYQLISGVSAGPEYLVYYKHDYPRREGFQCDIDKLSDHGSANPPIQSRANRSPTGSQLRTYRIAVAATGEYTSFHGGIVNAGLSGIVTTLNRINGIYQSEVAIRLQLIANNSQIIFTNPATDPYTNSNGATMLSQNQSILDTFIGSANYDIGHVFSTGGGGVAGLGVACRGGIKARGVSGIDSPIGDPFTVGFVAHEIGHQFGANHTFNGTAGSCAGGNRNESTAYEPGSGTTVMSYAGFCGSHNIADANDDYFHTGSFDEIVSYTNFGLGDCAAQTDTGNTPPSVNAGASFTVPVSTPLRLIGTASDPDDDELVYRWEQFDLGVAGSPNSPFGNAPLFRSFPADTIPVRLLPRLDDILNHSQTIGEILPTYARTLHFRLTALDQQEGGGVNYDDVVHTVTDVAGPFEITSPNVVMTWTPGFMETITWDVANTNQSPVNCANVDILLSLDQGQSFLNVIALATPNDGFHTFAVPDLPTSTGRVQVQCTDNIFFDINDANLTILEQPADTDGDGISDDLDNCTLVANPDQSDTDGDGFGNLCDADVTNDGVINFSDLSVFRAVFFTTPASPTWNPDADLNGDNFINFTDLMIVRASFFLAPGPSGVAH